MLVHISATIDAERIQNIVESKSFPADLQKMVSECNLLSTYERPHKLLAKLSRLFDGALGNWKADIVNKMS
jgi:hypothetical protein